MGNVLPLAKDQPERIQVTSAATVASSPVLGPVFSHKDGLASLWLPPEHVLRGPAHLLLPLSHSQSVRNLSPSVLGTCPAEATGEGGSVCRGPTRPHLKPSPAC